MGKRTWTNAEKAFIRKNVSKLTNEEIAEHLGRTQAAIENKVRELGVARIFSKEEVEILKSVWGKSRAAICKALPKYTWRQLSKKANSLGLPSLKEAQGSTNLYSIISAMGVSESMADRWKQAGLRVVNDKTKQMKNNVCRVLIDDFWAFALKYSELVDLTKLKDNVQDVLGTPPQEIQDLQRDCVPLVSSRKHKVLGGEKRKEVAKLYYSTSIAPEKIADSYDISIDTLRHIASENRQEGQRRKRVKMLTPSFICQLQKLYYVDGKSRKECAEILCCSLSSVNRGIKQIVESTRPTAKGSKSN